ncbi:MAG: hypothetical protein CBC35_09665 [Planctomycetes bacterium TMED75]|nr:hypothetical protein [Planctomycetaceae bacterium]OUU91372.1 MAG: hypothetical protein CBC35_09665 [Planctomycetes bacterium TMED75]
MTDAPHDFDANDGERLDSEPNPERFDQLISENSFFVEKLHAEHDRRTRLQLEAMLAETPAIHFELDTSRKITYVNPTWERELGHPADQIVGSRLSDFVSQSSASLLDDAMSSALSENDFDGKPVICFIGMDGAPRWMSAKFRLNKIGCICGNLQDVSVHRELENERLRTQKINSIGRFAAGFAHDFNNLLMSISANLDLSTRKLAHQGIDLSELALALRACEHASQITQQLMNYSNIGQEQAPVVEASSINHLLQEAVEIAFRGSQSQPILCMDPSIPLVDMDGSQIHQVLNNLLLNAEQSMPHGGVIRIRLREHFYTPPQGGRPREGVAIEIRDQGVGIAAEDLEQVLEPYFTTKEMGNGLGLTTAYWIIQHHDGLLEIESARGSGTMVRVILPVSDCQELKSPVSAPELIQSTGLNVLVMDDDDSVRGVMGSMLEVLGHRFIGSRHGEECLSIYRHSLEPDSEIPPIDVVIVDLVVAGGRGGLWTIKKLAELDASLPVLVSTGYSKDPIIEEFEKHGFCGALQKPYSVDQLQQQIAAARHCSKADPSLAPHRID